MKFRTSLITTFTIASKFRRGEFDRNRECYIRALQLSALSFTHSLNAPQIIKVKAIWNWNFRHKRHKQVRRYSFAREWTSRKGKSRLEWKNSFPRSRKLRHSMPDCFEKWDLMPQSRRENFRKTLTECPLEIAFYLLEDIRTYRLLTIYFARPPQHLRDYF